MARRFTRDAEWNGWRCDRGSRWCVLAIIMDAGTSSSCSAGSSGGSTDRCDPPGVCAYSSSADQSISSCAAARGVCGAQQEHRDDDRRSTAAPDASLALAVDRPRLAHEHLDASIRTAASLISFGFTIYKFFQFEVDKAPSAAVDRLIGPPEFAITIIATGIVSLALATIQHSREMRLMRATTR